MSKAVVLLADDDRLVLATLASGLRNAGYTIIEACNGDEAIRFCEKQHPDIAILDVRMPGIDGIETARHLQDHTEIPFLMLSAYGDKEIVEQATDLNALSYLIKPMDVAQIIPAIEASLKKAAQIRKLKNSESRLMCALENDQSTSTAVGVVMERHHLSRDDAFEKLRRHARSQRRKLTDVADDLIKATETINIH
jgi:two-component system, response regulator PdtaR